MRRTAIQRAASAFARLGGLASAQTRTAEDMRRLAQRPRGPRAPACQCGEAKSRHRTTRDGRTGACRDCLCLGYRPEK